MNIHEVITDSSVFHKQYIMRDGIAFTRVTHPGNVFDAVLIKNPADVVCSSPLIKGCSTRSFDEQISYINQNRIEKAMIIAEDISFITKCPTLKHLRIIPPDDTKDGFDYSPLYEMPQIKSVSLKTVYGFKEKHYSSVDCARIRGLESIHITDDGFKNYKQIRTLKDLGLANYKEMDLTNAFCSPELDSLFIITSKIKSIEGIQSAPKMQCLYLYYNRSLRDISALKNVSQTLRALRIENCPKIEDFSVLAELDQLELLELSGSNELESLNFLKEMKNLKTLVFSMNVKDGDLTPCLGLSYVYSDRNRRHYNLKNDELPKIKYVRGNENIEAWRRMD